MATFGSLLLAVFVVFLITSWIVPWLLAWFFKIRLNLNVSIGRIGLGWPYLILKEVHITRSGFSIQIEEVALRSSFLSSQVSKLLLVIIKDVRIKKDIGQSPEEGAFDPTPSRINVKDLKVPPVLISLTQFLAVHVHRVTVMLLRSVSPECLVHAAADELYVDGSVVHGARLLASVRCTSASAKILKHQQHGQAHEDVHVVLGEVAFGLALEATLLAQGPLSVEKLAVEVEKPQAVINDGFFELVQAQRLSSSAARKVDKPMWVDDNTSWQIASKILPKNFSLKVDCTTLTGMRDHSRPEFCAVLQSFAVKSSFSSVPFDMLMNVEVEEVKVRCSQVTLLRLKKLRVDGKVLNDTPMVDVLLDTLSVTYTHRDIFMWASTNFSLPSGAQLTRQVSSRASKKPTPRWLLELLSRLQANVELWNIAVSLQLTDNHNAGMGCNHAKLAFVSVLDDFEEEVPLMQAWTGELLVEALWWRLGVPVLDSPDPQAKLQHIWGTPAYLGVLLLEAKKPNTLKGVMECVRFEWSDELAKFVQQAAKCLLEFRALVPVRAAAARHSVVSLPTGESSLEEISVGVTVSNVNIFLVVNDGRKADKAVMLRLDSSRVDRARGKLGVSIDGARLLTMDTGLYYNCVRADELKQPWALLRGAKLTVKGPEVTVQSSDQISMEWSTELHLQLLGLFEDIRAFVRGLVPVLTESEVASGVSTGPQKRVVVRLKGEVALGIRISSRHDLRLCFDDLAASVAGSEVAANASRARIAVDGADTFFIDSLIVATLQDSEEIRAERRSLESFVLAWNRTWSVSMRTLLVRFPYEHNFADAVQNEFVSLFKWLKVVHKYERRPFNAASPLPPDLLVRVHEFAFEMSDDPFEVRLRDNYELLEDEYREAETRKKMLAAKVEELQKNILHFPSGKVEELYKGLNKKNAEIYIQRSKQISQSGPPRTRLFAWTMQELEVLALADPSVHGTDRVLHVMAEIDRDSPWPVGGLGFTTLWCRAIRLNCKEWKFLLRDFPQPLLHIRSMLVWGRLVGAEQEAPKRARRTCQVELAPGWPSETIERGMASLKFYHDLSCDTEHFSYAFGPCWEPVIAQCNLSFERIVSPSRDPSPPLPFWDKMRLLYHGRLTMSMQTMTVLLHASLDPYNTTEEMELTWSEVVMDWTNAKFVFKGDLNIYVKTASKYDDCRLLHLPNLKLTLKLNWVCLGDPNDHHSVLPCAPDKLPEYSSNQEHDSFRAFRSQHVNLSIAVETKPASNSGGPSGNFDFPIALLYGSTLRWFESLKLILSGVTRPTRRGKLFKNVRPRKLQLSRHYRKIHLLLGLHQFQVCYWMSFAKQRGFELLGGRISCSSEHILNLVPVDDGLVHRPRAEWSIGYMNCELNDAEIWLQSALEEEKEQVSLRQPVEKCYFLSLAKVSYGRETTLEKDPHHRLVVYDLKGAWTKSNRDVAFALFDSFVKSQQLKKNLSTDALKVFKNETANTPMKNRPRPNDNLSVSTPTNPTLQQATATPSPMTKLQSGHAATMLQQLIAEVDNKNVVYSDDLSTQNKEQILQGLVSCSEHDVFYENWHIVLVNSQVLLKGCETKGYVIMSAAKAQILQRIHRPVWKQHTLVSKTTWVGSLECMQYYATVIAGDTPDENIMWLTIDNIEEKEKDSAVIEKPADVPDIVGSGHSVGGIVSETVGVGTETENSPIQLQRIVSRCKCEFFYACYGDNSLDPSSIDQVPPPPSDEGLGPWEQREQGVDAFTLMHHDLDVCTNSLQYAMILDIVNNLLLHVEPSRKEAAERMQRMRFQLQLHSYEDQRKPIQQLQNQVRSLVSKLRRLEKKTHQIQSKLCEESSSLELLAEEESLEKQVYECKEMLGAQSEELHVMISCFKETQITANQKLATMRGDKSVATIRANEICFKYAKWRLTEADGQLGIADLILSNFLYTKNSRSDDSVEHLLELGYVRMTNLLPNQVYTEVLLPTEIQSNMPVDHKRAVRVFCREKAPVGGISVKEHFEINVVPLTIGLTKNFYNTMLKFCFPERDPNTIDDDELETDTKGGLRRGGSKGSKGSKGKEASFYVKIQRKDDVEKMKERAEKNKLFIYIKIPEVPVRVSYKGSKEKNIEDIRDFSLTIPTLEYHNVTWTWLDLLLAMKNDSRRVILSQAIKQKLQIKMTRTAVEERASPQEEDKARMLFGPRSMPVGESSKTGSLKKSIFKTGK
ncbi:protein hobbit [Cloeon dipterum]|uniref:protein hobbit n=1 Tax=Cloeon dipterum TaxID=197152 RepID=UPI0032204D88